MPQIPFDYQQAKQYAVDDSMYGMSSGASTKLGKSSNTANNNKSNKRGLM